jgi:hypothetical protein
MKPEFLMSSNAPGTFLRLAWRISLAFFFVAYAPVLVQAQSSTSNSGIDDDHVQMLDQYCSECHNFDDFAGGLAFDLLDTSNLLTDAESWEKVLLKPY